MGNPDHRTLILEPKYDAVGVGHSTGGSNYSDYWVIILLGGVNIQ